MSTTQPITLHKRSFSSFAVFASADVIEVEDLSGLTAVELYGVITEHWSKCSPFAKRNLISHVNPAVRMHAALMAEVMDEAALTCAA